MSEFAGTDYDFAAGSLFGLRGWHMDEMGRLHGVTHREVWRPGENASVCKKEGQTPCPQINRRDEARNASEAGRAKVASKKKRNKRSRDVEAYTWQTFETKVSLHTSPTTTACGDPACVRGEYHTVTSNHHFDPSCQCGFWAYDEAGFEPKGKVIGVIEAYGKTTIGTKDFRAEKARIVAISMEDAGGSRLTRSILARLAELYPDAGHYENTDDLVTAFPGTLRSWPKVDGGFWLKPVSEPEGLGVWKTWGLSPLMFRGIS